MLETKVQSKIVKILGLNLGKKTWRRIVHAHLSFLPQALTTHLDNALSTMFFQYMDDADEISSQTVLTTNLTIRHGETISVFVFVSLSKRESDEREWKGVRE